MLSKNKILKENPSDNSSSQTPVKEDENKTTDGIMKNYGGKINETEILSLMGWQL